MLAQLAGYYSQGGEVLLLDQPELSGVTVNAAYSPRKLRAAYAGAAARYRRSSDSSELDIGFVGNELDTSALLDFVGAGNGFTALWYDQSTAARNLSTTIQADQPRGANSGALETLNGQPTLRWLTSQLNFPAGFTITLPTTVYAVLNTTALGTVARVFLERTSGAVANLALYLGGSGISGGTSYRPSIYWNGSHRAQWGADIRRNALVRWRFTASETATRVDNAVEVTGTVGTQLTNWASLGNAAVQDLNDLPVSELLICTSTVDTEADAAILADYNARYGVF